MKLILAFLLVASVLISCSPREKNKGEYTLIKGATIIHPGSMEQDQDNGYVLLKGNSIVATGPYSENLEIPPGSKIIDASGKFIIPGLIDGFAVINNQFYANAFLYSGITTILGVDGGRRGWFYPNADPGPDFYMLESIGDEFAPDSVHLSHLQALHQKNYKIALLKYKLLPSQVKLIHEEARKLGMGTIGELGYTTYKEAGQMGVNAFVHTTRYSLDIAPEPMRKAVADFPFSNDLRSPKWKYYQYLYDLDSADKSLHQHASNLAASGTFLMPTMSLLYGDLPGLPNPWDEPVAAILNPGDINNPLDKKSGKHHYSEEVQKNYTSMGLQELILESVYHAAGAKYLAGSGTDVWGTMPGISLHTELMLLHRIGLSHREALASATSHFHEAFGWNTGVIEAGFEADLLILNSNPIENLNNLKDIFIVINNGELINREDLIRIAYDKNLKDGTIIDRKAFDPLKDSLTHKRVFKDLISDNTYSYLEDVFTEEMLYSSDGFRVKAYLTRPKKPGKYPVIIYNRGGNREFSKISPWRVVDVLSRIASWGYMVIGSQYRGVDGGDGQEEFGGADIRDVLNLVPVIASIPEADTNSIGMYGRSRGGMMTYLALTKTDRIKAAVVVGGIGNLQQVNDSRQGIMERYVYSQLIPDYWQNKDSLLWARSAIYAIDKMTKETPVLILHGTSDWRVVPQESYAMAQAFQDNQIPYRLVMFEGGDHRLTEFKDESNELMRSWFEKYLKQNERLPDLNPHGK